MVVAFVASLQPIPSSSMNTDQARNALSPRRCCFWRPDPRLSRGHDGRSTRWQVRRGQGEDRYVQFRSVDIHQHNPINVFSTATTRDLKLRAAVRDTAADGRVATVTISVAQYTKKHGVKVDEAPNTDPLWIAAFLDLPLTFSKGKKTLRYTGSIPGATIKQAAVLGGMPVGATAYLCIDAADLTTAPVDPATEFTANEPAKQVTKKVGGGDCVKIINVDPATTTQKADNPEKPDQDSGPRGSRRPEAVRRLQCYGSPGHAVRSDVPSVWWFQAIA